MKPLKRQVAAGIIISRRGAARREARRRRLTQPNARSIAGTALWSSWPQFPRLSLPHRDLAEDLTVIVKTHFTMSFRTSSCLCIYDFVVIN